MKKLSDIQIGLDFNNAPQPPLKLRGGDEPTVGALSSGGVMTREESLVWEIVREHRGKDAAILGPMVSAQVGIPYDTVRATISGLINHHGKLIGSYSRGYYVIVDPVEVDEVYRSLRHRGIAILFRASRIKKISIVEVFGQGELHESGN